MGCCSSREHGVSGKAPKITAAVIRHSYLRLCEMRSLDDGRCLSTSYSTDLSAASMSTVFKRRYTTQPARPAPR